MKQVNGFWLPDRDTFFVTRPNYEIEDTKLALRHVTSFRTAIDVGAHCGFWTRRLAEKFNQVTAIEPVPEHFACLTENTKSLSNVNRINRAASDTNETLRLSITAENSGMSYVSDEGNVIVDTVTIDSLNLTDVDFIKADVEGFEPQVLLGALATIEKYKPVIVTEILRNNVAPIYDILTKFGYKQIARRACNYIWKT